MNPTPIKLSVANRPVANRSRLRLLVAVAFVVLAVTGLALLFTSPSASAQIPGISLDLDCKEAPNPHRRRGTWPGSSPPALPQRHRPPTPSARTHWRVRLRCTATAG